MLCYLEAGSRAQSVVRIRTKDNSAKRPVDEERGLAGYRPEVSDILLDRLAHSAAGDARVALTALDAAVESTDPNEEESELSRADVIEDLAEPTTLTIRVAKNTTTWLRP